ncbi:tetratricopeptide (TPR) repeat protein [Pseudomonas laurylsulfatiphila]|uniref:LA2681 family HEPN domain-containing protein n=1 Tax=Pseudomonas laurylsulfatiphila TaxID=2011015 RepID=UPI003D1FEBEA
MQDFFEHLSDNGYQPRAEDRHLLMQVVNAHIDTGEFVDRLRCVFDSLVDASCDADDRDLLHGAIALAEKVASLCSPVDACLTHYACSNAWSHLHVLDERENAAGRLDHPALLKQLYYLHAAVQHQGFAELEAPLRARIYCNLGNALSVCGRWIEALAEWRMALAEQPILGMALGNLGIGLCRYGGALYDPGHAHWFFIHARRHLESAIEGGIGRDGSTFAEAITAFRWYQERLAGQVEEEDDSHLFQHSLGRSKQERRYRQWCLDNHLFLNPMNDLGALPVAAWDVMGLPDHDAKVGITYLALFNQMKQEYAFARHCLYQGEHSGSIHLADKRVSLALNYDHALYSMGLEQIKTAFRASYSLLDKIAYFINAYWRLGVPETRVGFRTIWFKPLPRGAAANATPEIRDEFSCTPNLPLRALYWLSQDIYSKTLRNVARPDAKALDELRNHLEHKYAKVVDAAHFVTVDSGRHSDQLAYVIERDDLVAKARLITTLCRSALIYLSLAMHHEEARKPRDPEAFIMPIPVDNYPDDWKF